MKTKPKSTVPLHKNSPKRSVLPNSSNFSSNNFNFFSELKSFLLSKGFIIPLFFILFGITFSAFSFFRKVHGKVIILPFEVAGNKIPSESIGASFSISLAAAISRLDDVFPPERKNKDKKPFDTTQAEALVTPFNEGVQPSSSDFANFDPIEGVVRLIPQSRLEGLAFLNPKATVYSSQIGPFSIPVADALLYFAPQSYTDSKISGRIEHWDQSLRAAIYFGEESVPLLVAASQESVAAGSGYSDLLQRVVLEIAYRKWIKTLPPMRQEARLNFAYGLSAFQQYLRSRDPKDLTTAKMMYMAALNADQDADLVRLLLATAQYESRVRKRMAEYEAEFEPIRTISNEKAPAAGFDSTHNIGKSETRLLNEAATRPAGTDLQDAITNFSILRSVPGFKDVAEKGYVASALDYMQNSDGNCMPLYQFLEPVYQIAIDWGLRTLVKRDPGLPPDTDRTILIGNTLEHIASLLIQGGSCSEIAKTILHGKDPLAMLEVANLAIEQSISEVKFGTNGAASRMDPVGLLLYLQRKQKYVFDDYVDYYLNYLSFSAPEPDIVDESYIRSTRRMKAKSSRLLAKDYLTKSILLGERLISEREKIKSYAEKRRFGTFLLGSLAEDYQKAALLNPDEAAKNLEIAEARLKEMRAVGTPFSTEWAALRLAQLKYSQGDASGSADMLIKAHQARASIKQPIGTNVDLDQLSIGVLIERPERLSGLIESLSDMKNSDTDNVFIQVLLADAYRKRGDCEAALKTLNTAQTVLSSSAMRGNENISLKLTLVREKIRVSDSFEKYTSQTFIEKILPELMQRGPSNGSVNPAVKYDFVELMSIGGNRKLAGRMKLPVWLPADRGMAGSQVTGCSQSASGKG